MPAFGELNCLELLAILLLLLAISLFSDRFFDKIVAYAFLSWSICEIVIAVLQATGIIDPINSFFLCTGSFNNSGPFSGFLAITACVLVPYSLNCDNRYVKAVLLSVASIEVFLIFLLQSRASVLALMICFLFFSLRQDKCRLWIKRHWPTLLVCSGLLVCLFYYIKKPSADGRLFINRMSVSIMKSNGLKGLDGISYAGAYGVEQFNYFRGQMEQGQDVLNWTLLDEDERMIADCPEYAFNEFLWIGAEYGIIALLLFVGILVISIYNSLIEDRPWLFGIISFSVFAFFSYPLHTVQIQIVLCVLLVACLYRTEVKYRWIKTALVLLMTSVLFGYELFHDPQFNKTIRQDWKETDRWYMLGEYEFAAEGCDTLLDYKKKDKDFLFKYGRSLHFIGDYLKSDSILELGTHISSDPMFWNIMGNNSLALGKYREAEERYKHAFYMVPNRLYPLYLLAKLYHVEGDTIRFLDMSERVETFKSKVESANTERLRTEIRDMKAGYISE